MEQRQTDRTKRVRMGLYGSSLGISVTALAVVAVLELLMLGYTALNRELYGPFLWKYRFFYLFLLALAVVSILLNLYVKRDIARRYAILAVANPVCAICFFAWSLAITWSDSTVTGVADPTVFMTFSLVVPLSFSLLPGVYAAVVLLADALMLYLTAAVNGAGAPLINLVVFFIFQVVLGVSFLRLKMKLSVRLAVEEENADLDVMTGLSNRRVYEEDLKRFAQAPLPEDLHYIVIDLNGLKDVNDRHGHDAGDSLIVGAARCIEQCFGAKGSVYRIGGDEFVVLLTADREVLARLLGELEAGMKTWSDGGGVALSAAYGAASLAEYPGSEITGLAKAADQRMYEAKARYYESIGRDRRRHAAADTADSAPG